MLATLLSHADRNAGLKLLHDAPPNVAELWWAAGQSPRVLHGAIRNQTAHHPAYLPPKLPD
jgi:hypothetical protein